MTDGIDEADRPVALTGAGTDLFSKFDPLIEMRAKLLSTGQEDPYSLVQSSNKLLRFLEDQKAG